MMTLNQNIQKRYGDAGQKWLAALPTLQAKLALKYKLADLKPIANMGFCYVASGRQNNTPIVLKLGFEEKAMANEASCLEAFSHYGTCKLLASEPGMILMQKANPGTTLEEYFPDRGKQTVNILCQSIQELQKAEIPKQHNFLPLKKTYLI